MAEAKKRERSRNGYLFELCGWTLVMGLGIWELTHRNGGFGAWLQTGVALMGVVKAGWSLRAGDL